jgi:UDP-glucuronate 4-epimerase
LYGKKILITGGTGQVARPLAEALASANNVWYMDDTAAEAYRALPTDFTHVFHSAFRRGDGTDFT